MLATLAWNGLHPTIVHFPIALLAVAPILIVVGLLAKDEGAFLASALMVMALGTAGAWLAVASGDAAGNLAERVPDARVVLERHGEMGATTRTIFTALTLAFAAYLVAPVAVNREPTRAMRLGMYGAFLAAYAGALLYLANTAREGGRVAHEGGIHAFVVPGAVGLSLGACAMGREGPGAARGSTVNDVAVVGA